MADKFIVQELAEFSTKLKFEDIPERVVERARLQILSVVSAIHSSAYISSSRKLISAVKNWSGKGNCSSLPFGDKLPIADAVYLSAGLSVAQDYDDYLLFGHTGHSSVVGSLLVGEMVNASLEDVITAQVIANEIEGRIGAGVLLGPHNGQTWSFIHLIGSACLASKLLGLDAEKTAHSLAISMYQPCYVLYPGFMGPDSKLLTSATPTAIGIQSAILASEGFQGALDILENRQGFFRHFSYYPMPFWVSGLGKTWVTDTLAYKIYPGCAYIDTTVDAVLKILDDYKAQSGKELHSEEVEEVRVEATALTVEMDALSKVGVSFDLLNPVSINFSIPANVAICLLKKRLFGEDLDPEKLLKDKEAIMKLSERVKLKHNLSLTIEMIRTMSPSLKLDKLIASLSLLKIASSALKMRAQYGRRLGIEFDVLWDYLKKDGKRVFREIEKAINQRIGNWFKGVEKDGHWELGECDLEHFSMPFSARVFVRLKDGTELSHFQKSPKAGAGEPIEEQAKLVEEKFIREAGRRLGKKQAERVVRQSRELHKIKKVKNFLEEIIGG